MAGRADFEVMLDGEAQDLRALSGRGVLALMEN